MSLFCSELYFQNYYDQGDSSQTYDNTQVAAIATDAIDKKINNDLELVEHTLSLDVDKLNREVIDQDINLWGALENSKWLPCEVFEVAA